MLARVPASTPRRLCTSPALSPDPLAAGMLQEASLPPALSHSTATAAFRSALSGSAAAPAARARPRPVSVGRSHVRVDRCRSATHRDFPPRLAGPAQASPQQRRSLLDSPVASPPAAGHLRGRLLLHCPQHCSPALRPRSRLTERIPPTQRHLLDPVEGHHKHCALRRRSPSFHPLAELPASTHASPGLHRCSPSVSHLPVQELPVPCVHRDQHSTAIILSIQTQQRLHVSGRHASGMHADGMHASGMQPAHTDTDVSESFMLRSSLATADCSDPHSWTA